jgi:hypothetical protein
VIRFWNHDVIGRLDDVKRSIWHELQSPPHLGPLLPHGEERETSPSPPFREERVRAKRAGEVG